MGGAKQYYMEMTEGGLNLFAAEGRHVCAECFGDEGLQDFINEHVEETACDYCDADAEEPIAASLTEVVRYMDACLAREYDQAENCLYYETAEGGFQGDHWDTYDLLQDKLEIELPNDDGTLFDTLCKALGDRTWCDADPSGLSDATHLVYCWARFCEAIKHERRFFFMTSRNSEPEEHGLLSPQDVLEMIARSCVETGLIRTLPRGERVIRARYQPSGKCLQGPLDLGPPPNEFATQTNRMSPPGIPLFYAARDERTALLETADQPGDYAVGVFELQRDARILDLTKVPWNPSLFDEARAHLRRPIQFLREFVDDISKPIARDDRVHVEYIPTQVVTEYFREQFCDEHGAIDGIAYPSTRHGGGVCYALFATQHDLVVSASDIAHLEPWKQAQWRNGWLSLAAQHIRPHI